MKNRNTTAVKIGCIAFGTLLSIVSWAQRGEQGYRFDIKVSDFKDTTMFLGYCYGESTFLKDTAEAKGGVFHFEGKDKLPQGVYFVVRGRLRLFDLMVSDDQHFSLQTKEGNYVESMKVEGSDDNRILYENMLFNAARHQEADPFVAILKDSLASNDKKKEARKALDTIDQKVVKYQNKLIAQYPRTLTARWLKATQDIVVPDSLINNTEADASVEAYRYYSNHYFDNIDLTDDALLRLPTPFYSEKLLEYLDKVVTINPDSIVQAVKQLASKAEKNQETYKYLVWIAFTHYQQPKYMGLDKVYVDLYDYYFASGKMDFWIGEGIKKNIKEEADRLRLSLIGNKAPNLIMQDRNLALQSMYDIKKRYTLIFFFDPDCGHCKTETPKLIDFYNENKKRFDLEVYAVCSDTSMQRMKEYIDTMKMPWITVNGPRTVVGPYSKLYDVNATPTLYVLDEKKIIIAKKPPIETLASFLENYEEVQRNIKAQREGGEKGRGG